MKEIDNDFKYCRSCYDHLAGKVGVMITESLVSQGFIELTDNDYAITEEGKKFFEHFGLVLSELQKQKRNFAKPCLDVSEKKYHIAGSLGSALLSRMIFLKWISKIEKSRALAMTPLGKHELKNQFKVEL